MSAFVKQIAIVLLASWVLGGYPLYLWGGLDILIAAGVGCAICALNVTAGACLALWGLRRDNHTFTMVVFGGTGVRLIIVLLFFFLGLKLAKLHVFGLTLSLFFFFIVFQILEIRFFIGHSSDKANA